MSIRLPEKVNFIISRLTDAGFEAYSVGGCIRDSLLQRTPEDWDITTSARPEQVKRLFRRTVDTGIKHGTVTVLIGDDGFEVTTYRLDGVYEDSRHPKEVTFTTTLTEDLSRRDFTINALAYNDQDGLIDAFSGLSDLENGLIRAVGNPCERFSEDALRIMRAVRFSAQLNFTIEEKTFEAIRPKAENLKKISAERIRVELTRLLCSKHPEKLLTLSECGITAVILPEFDHALLTEQNNQHHMYDVGRHTIETLKHSTIYDEKLSEQERTVLRLTMLLHDLGKPDCHTRDADGTDHFKGHSEASVKIADDILRRLKFDNKTIDQVLTLVRYHDHRDAASKRSVRRTAVKVGTELMPLWFLVRRCDTMGQSVYIREEKLAQIDEYERVYQEILTEQDCLSLKAMAVKGKDLIEAGIAPGPELGRILNEMLELVLDEPSRNTKEYLMGRLEDLV